MNLKKRLLKLGCISLLLLSFVGYFAFSTFVFSPLEGRFNADVAGLIPRGVDLYVARAELRSSFARFPDLAVMEELENNKGFQELMGSPAWAEFAREHRVEQVLADVRAQLAQLPAGLDVFDFIGGEDLAVAANFTGGPSRRRSGRPTHAFPSGGAAPSLPWTTPVSSGSKPGA